MKNSVQSESSRVLLKRLKNTLAEEGDSQTRLNNIVGLIASSMKAEVCSIYLKDNNALELFASEGLKADSVHLTKLKIGEGLVGKIAQTSEPINTDDVKKTQGFRFIPETGEERYSSFLGVAIQRLGEILGVLIVQNVRKRKYTEDDVYGLEIIAMVLAEMTELGIFSSGNKKSFNKRKKLPLFLSGISVQKGIAIGKVILQEPKLVIENPIADNPKNEKEKLNNAFKKLQKNIESLINKNFSIKPGAYFEILEAYQLFAKDKGWRRRMEESIESGLSAPLAVEKEQSETRAKMSKISDPYIKERLHDLDDLSNRLIKILTKHDTKKLLNSSEKFILVARNIGPGELLDYRNNICGVILEEGSVGSHASIVASSLAIPSLIQSSDIIRHAYEGDLVIIDGDQGKIHLRPEQKVLRQFKKIKEDYRKAEEKYQTIRNKKAKTKDGINIKLFMNAGLMADLPSLQKSGADGVGLFRTELQFLTRSKIPKRSEQSNLYSKILDSSHGKEVNFRTVDIGSDKIINFVERKREANPSLGWRAIRLSLDKKIIMRIQVQALLRASKGRSLKVMFPFISNFSEFEEARNLVLDEYQKEKNKKHLVPKSLKIGSMLEVPSLAFENEKFFKIVDFICIGGNDLKQFFFAADRENEKVRQRYDSLDKNYIEFLKFIIQKTNKFKTPVSFCGEDAGKPIEALVLSALGIRNLSMNPSSIGLIKRVIRDINLKDIQKIIDNSETQNYSSLRKDLLNFLKVHTSLPVH